MQARENLGHLAGDHLQLAAELAQLLGCRRVSVGLRDGATVRIVATSLGREVDARLGAAALLAAAMNESLDQAATVAVPADRQAVPLVAFAHSQLALQGAACTVPLKGAGDGAHDGGAAPLLAGALIGWTGATAAFVLSAMLSVVAAGFLAGLLGMLAPSLYIAWRARAHARNTLRCEWIKT